MMTVAPHDSADGKQLPRREGLQRTDTRPQVWFFYDPGLRDPMTEIYSKFTTAGWQTSKSARFQYEKENPFSIRYF
jgi:hypothetical protein